jgi:membrane-associated phospholipid phosphatase
MTVTPPLSAGEPWPWRRALAWLVFLGPFFFLTYGFATWAAAQRAALPSIVFGWEHAIPFWAWTILPYWSIDVLYALSLFACSSRSELDTHARRLLTAQVVAVTCFLVTPLRFSFTQPATDGAWGAMFALLTRFDQPFNQAPSLHLALAVILWALYARKLQGFARAAMTIWFILIGASALTTYQHHFIDVPTGLLLGLLCMWVWPFADEGDGRWIGAHWQWTHDSRRLRLAVIYGSGAFALALLAIAEGGWALWLCWPALSLALVASAYAALGVDAFQKRADGAVSYASRWLFAPYRAGAWVNSRAWTLADAGPVAIADGVYLGRVPAPHELAKWQNAIVDMTAEFSLRAPVHDARGGDAPRTMISVPVLDLVPPDAAQLARAAEAIERARTGGPVLVCCALGASRGACAVAAWLLATGRAADVASALSVVRATRSTVVFRSGHVAALDGLVRRPLVQRAITIGAVRVPMATEGQA